MKRKISILLALVLGISLCLVPAVASAVEPYDSTLILENKDASWQVIPDATKGTLEFNSSGPTFDYRLTVTGLENSVDYSIIYYADKPDRFVDWGGDNPGAVIGTFKYDALLKVTSGSVDLGMSLPSPPDANISFYDYTEPAVQNPPYATAHGAKIWVVPSDCYGAASPERVTTWAPTRFLFETDLIRYLDTDVTLTAETPQIIAILVYPNSISFGTVMPGQNISGPDINVKNVGTVTVNVDAQLAKSTPVFRYLFLNTVEQPDGTWGPGQLGMSGMVPTAVRSCSTELKVPATYSASGTETANLIFWAEAS